VDVGVSGPASSIATASGGAVDAGSARGLRL